MNKRIDVVMKITDNWIFGDIVENYSDKLFTYEYSVWYDSSRAGDMGKDSWNSNQEGDFEEDSIGFFNISHIVIKNMLITFLLKLDEED